MSFHCLQEKPVFTLDNLREELSTLTEQQKREATRDLFGFEWSDPIEETPEFISQKIDSLIEKLDEAEEKEAFELASFTNPDYVLSQSFLIMFLRAERYDTSKAAKRIVKYWDRKVQLFGTEVSFRRLELNDLKLEDLPAILLGGVRELPDDDLAGRPIIVSYRRFWDNRPTHMESNVRLLWFVVHDAIEQESTQKNGIVWMLKNDMPMGTVSLIPVDQVLDVRDALPVRCAGIHMFLPNRWVQYMFEHMLFYADTEIRARTRQYIGTNVEEHFEELAKFGIVREMLPPQFGGDSEFNYLEWITFVLKDGAVRLNQSEDMDEDSSDAHY